MDCDEQHEAKYIPHFRAAVADEADAADIISGTRYANGHAAGEGAPPERREINRIITATLNRRLGLNITDAFCGFKAYRVSALRHIHITVPGYAMPMQFWVQAARAGLRVRELPVRLIYNDPTRHFGGLLDDPAIRLQHYLEVLETELCVKDLAPRLVLFSSRQRSRALPLTGRGSDEPSSAATPRVDVVSCTRSTSDSCSTSRS